MTEMLLPVGGWFLHVTIGGGLLLLLGCLLVAVCRAPALRQRVGAWTVAAALLLAVLSLLPAWLPVSAESWFAQSPATAPPTPPVAERPVAVPAAPATSNEPTADFVCREQAEQLAPALAVVVFPTATEPLAPATVAPAPPTSSGHEPSFRLDWRLILIIAAAVYLAVALVLLGRGMVGYLGLSRLLAGAAPAPRHARRLFHGLTEGMFPRPRLLVSPKVKAPVCCGLLRPTVVLPVGLADTADRDTLKWVFAHELTHLVRGDSWTALGLWLGEVVYFHLPWLWWLRRQVRLCQEFVADAAAVDADQRAADYAEFLVGLSGPTAAPHGSTGVRGTTSDLMRRVTMLLKDPIRTLPRRARWQSRLAAAALVVTAVGVAGVGLRANAAAKADPPPDQKKQAAPKDEPKKAEAPRDDTAQSLDEARKQLRQAAEALKQAKRGGAADADVSKMQAELSRALATLQQLQSKQALLRAGRARLQADDAVEQARKRAEDAQKRATDAQKRMGELMRQQQRLFGGNDALRGQMEKMMKDLEQQLQSQGVPKEAIEQMRKSLEGLKAQGLLGPNMPNFRMPNVRVIPNMVFPGNNNPFGAGRETNTNNRLGVRVERPSPAMVEQLDLPRDSGIVVTDVMPESAAAKAGLKANDIVLEIGGSPAKSDPHAFIRQIGSLKAGQALDVVVLRKGRKETLKGLKLPEARAEAPAQPNRRQPFPVQPGQLFQPQPGQFQFRMVPNLQPQLVAPGAVGSSTSVTVNDGAFTIAHHDGNLKITLKGQVEDGKAKPSSIVIDDNGKRAEASSLDKVPTQYKERVQQLLQGVGSGTFRFQFKR